MIRPILAIVLPVALPFLVWFGWGLAVRMIRKSRGVPAGDPPSVPLALLLFLSCFLMAMMIFILSVSGFLRGQPPGTPYVPVQSGEKDLNTRPASEVF